MAELALVHPVAEQRHTEMTMRTLRSSLSASPTVDLGVRNWVEDRLKTAEKKRALVAEVHTLTPQLARELLTRNDGNRTLRVSKVKQYEADIRAGRWALNGESIIINRAGNLDDGQHRCFAVVETDTPIESVFVFGTDPAARYTLDNGANRGAADHLSFEGVKYAGCVAGTARLLLCYEAHKKQSVAHIASLSALEVFQRGLADKAIERSASVPYSSLQKSKKFAGPSVLAFCHYIFAQRHREQADMFITQVIRGVSLEEWAPAYQARERLNGLPHVTREYRIEVLIRAWNAYRSNGGHDTSLVLYKGGKLPAVK